MHRLALLAVPTLAAFVVGCAREPVGHTVRKVPAETNAESQQTRSEFEGMLKASLEKLEEEVRELRMKAERLEQSAQAKWTEKIAELEAKQRAAREKLDEVAESTGEAWKSLRDGVRNAREEFEKAVRKARSEF